MTPSPSRKALEGAKPSATISFSQGQRLHPTGGTSAEHMFISLLEYMQLTSPELVGLKLSYSGKNRDEIARSSKMKYVMLVKASLCIHTVDRFVAWGSCEALRCMGTAA